MYHNPCNICRKFVDTESGCPCLALGKEKAIKRTWIAIEEYEDKVKLQQRKTTT
jgi:quinol monooxygenase YgiN